MAPALFKKKKSSEAHSNDQETMGYLTSSASDWPNNVHLSKPLTDGSCFASSQLSSSAIRARELDSYAVENNSVSWSTDDVENFLDIQVDVPFENSQEETCTGVVSSDNHTKRTDWCKWAEDQLITADDSLDSNLSDLLVDLNVPDLDAKVRSSFLSTVQFYTSYFPNSFKFSLFYCKLQCFIETIRLVLFLHHDYY